MKSSQSLDTKRVAQIFSTAITWRNEFCSANGFIKMPDVWNDLCSAGDNWKVKKYVPSNRSEYKPKASVNAVGHSLILTVDTAFWGRAERGERFPNFVLAHELGHVMAGHIDRKASLKHFNLGQVGAQMMGIVTSELTEKEANLAGVFFQCGMSLRDPRWEAKTLAERALDLSPIRAAPSARLGHPAFEGQGAFSSQC